MMLNLYFLLILWVCKSSHSDSTTTDDDGDNGGEDLGDTRRILQGRESLHTRPYMVYLRPTMSDNNQVDQNWLCGGVIISSRYILTSAACIEDINYFYVVTGTYKWLPHSQTNECIDNGAMRAVWKCVPKSYHYDGDSFNNIHWMINDIAVVMTEERINFDRRVKGCDFIPQKIAFNNISRSYESPGTKGYISGWGSIGTYNDAADIIARTSVNSPVLLETNSILVSKSYCKKQWLPRYSDIIEKYMFCGKALSTIVERGSDCQEDRIKCRQLLFSEEIGPRRRRFEKDPDKLLMDSAAQAKKMKKLRQLKTARRNSDSASSPYTNRRGGFCENDHGGPLVVGQGRSALVVGIITAYRVQNHSKKCFGPYLYTSVYLNRDLIQCALFKETGNSCETVLRDSSFIIEQEDLDWSGVPRSRDVGLIKYEDEDDDSTHAAPTGLGGADETGISRKGSEGTTNSIIATTHNDKT